MVYLCGEDPSSKVLAQDPASKSMRVAGQDQPVISGESKEAVERHVPVTSNERFVVVEGEGPFIVVGFLTPAH